MLSAALCTTADGRLCQTHACAGPRHSTWCDATNGRAGRCAPACFGLLLHVWASELRGCDLLAEATPSHGLRRLKSVAFKSAQLASDVSSGAALPTLAHSRHIVAELSHLASNSFELWLGMRQPRVRRTEEGCTVEAARLLTFQGELVMDLLAAAIANKSRHEPPPQESGRRQLRAEHARHAVVSCTGSAVRAQEEGLARTAAGAKQHVDAPLVAAVVGGMLPSFGYGTVWLLFEVQPEGLNHDERQTDPRGDAWRDTSALPRRINTSRGVNDTFSERAPPSTLPSGADTPQGTSPALDDELAVEPEMVMPWAEDAAGLEVRLPNSSSFKCGSACARLGAASPNLIVFNRVPKCGSTTLEHIIRRQSLRRAFRFVRSEDYANNSMNLKDQRRFATMASELGANGRMVYDRHVLYVDFARFGLPAPTYINIVRDPLAMELSAYYFWRQCVCITRQPFCRSASARVAELNQQSRAVPSPAGVCSMSIDEIYRHVAPQPRLGIMTRWFCGQLPLCKVPDPQPLPVRLRALHRAMHNVRHAYAWVGVLEQFEESLALLVRLLPSYFGGLHVAQAAREHARPSNISSSAPQPSRETLHKIAMENENDIRLYRYISNLLECRLQQCGISSSEGNTTLLQAGSVEGGHDLEWLDDPVSFSTVANAAARKILE
ncbi:hypothetical protein AB1Y20_009618 [Prymnesium parvum]|uniref:Protein-tyrosine sulfotransferase n=1 Tax=Prymnesium parvum TaxID=97485 RepID=A0AB34K202_PRYPA